MRELTEDTFFGNKNEGAHVHVDRVHNIGPIPKMTPTQALTAIQIMADHSQKWHNGTSSRFVSSNSNTNGLAAIISKLDNLGRDMKKLKENVHAIQVGCASVNVMPRNTFEHLRLANLRNTNMLVEMADMTKKEPLGIDNARVSYDMEKKDHNFITPTEKIFMIKSDLENRPQSLACSDNQSRNLHDMSPGDSLHNQGSTNKKIKLDQHTPRAYFVNLLSSLSKKRL
nr:hypothetical protein [Tanacetum cinerariifolium]